MLARARSRNRKSKLRVSDPAWKPPESADPPPRVDVLPEPTAASSNSWTSSRQWSLQQIPQGPEGGISPEDSQDQPSLLPPPRHTRHPPLLLWSLTHAWGQQHQAPHHVPPPAALPSLGFRLVLRSAARVAASRVPLKDATSLLGDRAAPAASNSECRTQRKPGSPSLGARSGWGPSGGGGEGLCPVAKLTPFLGTLPTCTKRSLSAPPQGNRLSSYGGSRRSKQQQTRTAGRVSGSG